MIQDSYYDDAYGCYKGANNLVDCQDPRCFQRDHACECGECCDACWFMCCALRRAIDTHLEALFAAATPVSNCGSVTLADLSDVINDISPDEDMIDDILLDE